MPRPLQHMKKDETDMTIETACAPIGEILYESFNALGEPGPVIRSLGPPKKTGPLRQGEAEMALGQSDKFSRAVSRLLAAGQLGEIIYPDGRKSTAFTTPPGLLEEEVQKLNDPTLTQVLVGTTLRVARSRHGYEREAEQTATTLHRLIFGH
jgi:hypothetical protein